MKKTVAVKSELNDQLLQTARVLSAKEEQKLKGGVGPWIDPSG